MELLEGDLGNIRGLEIDEYDFRSIVKNGEQMLDFFKNPTEDKLTDIFIEYFKRYDKIKNSLESNTANLKIENKNGIPLGKKYRIYEYYKNLDLKEFKKNIEESFNILFSEKDIEDLGEVLKKEDKVELYNLYHNILKKNLTEIATKKNIVEKIENNNLKLEDLEGINSLSKAQLVYKYILEKQIDEDVLKAVFPHLVQIEMKGILENFWGKSERISFYFPNTTKLKKLIENKLKNKLLNYINQQGKGLEFYDNKIIESFENMSIREREGELRNIIGAIVGGTFSFRNIVNPNYKGEILQLKELNGIDEELLKIFFGDDIEYDTSFIKSLQQYLYNLRNNVLHFKKNIDMVSLFYSVGDNNIKINLKEFNIDYAKLKLYEQMNSANIFEYFDDTSIKKYLKKTPIILKRECIEFAPSFYSIYEESTKYGDLLNIKSLEIENKELRDAQIYLYKQIYYNRFLVEFFEKKKFFKAVEDVKNSKKGRYSKLDKYDYSELVESFYTTKKTLGRKNEISKKILEMEGDIELLKKSPLYKDIEIIGFPDFKENTLKNFYCFLRLLDKREVANLKGVLEKSYRLNKNNREKINSLLEVLNLLNLVEKRSKGDIEKDFSIVKSFLYSEDSIDSIEKLYQFSKNPKGEDSLYSDRKNIVEFKAIYNLKKYCMQNLISEVVKKSKYGVTKKDIERYYSDKENIKSWYKKQQELHKKFVKSKFKINDKDYNEYKNVITNIADYTKLKNKVEFNITGKKSPTSIGGAMNCPKVI